MRRNPQSREQKNRKNMTLPKHSFDKSDSFQTYKYYLGPGNNNSLIRRVLSTRKHWQQIQDSKYVFLSFKWQQTTRGFNYDNCIENRILKQSLNHFEFHQQLSNKEYLLKNMFQYCQSHKMNVFDMLPVTYILNLNEQSYEQNQHLFLKFFQHNLPEDLRKRSRKQWMSFKRRPTLTSPSSVDKKLNYVHCKPQLRDVYKPDSSQFLWILKPTFYNRGTGIHLFNEIEQLEQLMSKYIIGCDSKQAEDISQKQFQKGSKQRDPDQETSEDKCHLQGSPGLRRKDFRIRESLTKRNIVKTNSFVVQKYLQKPLLISGRKFDIRVWVLLTHELKVYFFPQGYLRTSSYAYNTSLKSINDRNVHLTNNAVQKNNKEYGKYEDGNQLSFRHLENAVSNAGGDYQKLISSMKNIIKVSVLSVRKKINKRDRLWCFEILGYDFMVDSNCKPWLIEVNTNPCFEQSSLLLEDLLPRMLDDAFDLTLDKMFAPPQKNNYNSRSSIRHQNLWQLIVDLKK